MPFVAPPVPVTERVGIYTPTGWDAGYKAARRAAGTTPLRFLGLGDSIMQGQYANFSDAAPANYDYRSDGWFHQVAAGIRTKYGIADGGEFFSPLGDSALVVPAYVTGTYVSTTGTGLPPYSSPNTSSLTKTQDANGWWKLVYFTRVNTWGTVGDELLRFNPPSGTKRVDVVWTGYSTASGQTWKYNVLGTPGTGDGTVTVNFTTLNTGVAGDNGEPQVTTVYDSATALTQPVLLGNQSASSIMKIIGCIAYKDTTRGLQFGRLAYGGRTLAEMIQVASTLKPSNKLSSLFDTADGYTAFPRTPHLAIIEAVTNDCNQNVPNLSFGPNGYRNGLERTVGAIRRWNPTASIMILQPWHSTDFDDQGNSVNNSSWGGYQRAARAVAQARTCAYIDFTALFNPTPVANGYLSGDAHPTRTGYAAMAATVLGVL